MNAIVWLYRGEIDKYKALLEEYQSAMKEMIDEIGDDALNAIKDDLFIGGLEEAKRYLKTLRESAKKEIEACDRKEKKKLQTSWDEKTASVEEIAEAAKEAHWLYSKFGEGKHEDIPGFCKIADVEMIESKGWSLTLGGICRSCTGGG